MSVAGPVVDEPVPTSLTVPSWSTTHRRQYAGNAVLFVNSDEAPMSLADPLVDVRIATWLLMPDCGDLTDSPTRVTLKKGDTRWNLEGLLAQRAGKDAVTAALAVLRTVSGGTPGRVLLCGAMSAVVDDVVVMFAA